MSQSALYFIVLVFNIFVTFSMTGIIWFVQVVHYPLFAHVGADQFLHYEYLHKKLTTLVVAPLMLVELGTSAIMPVLAQGFQLKFLSVIGLILILFIFATTFFVQVPMHNKLTNVLSIHTIDSLVLSNWLRTIAWSLRSILVICLLAISISSSLGLIARDLSA